MKISCLQESLKRGISTVSRAVASKSPLPVLSHILLSTDEGRLKLSATDLEVGITYWLDAQVEEEGAVTVPSRLFSDVVGNLPNDKVTLTLDSRTVMTRVECGKFTSNIKGIEAEDFPPIPTVSSDEPSIHLPPALLREAIEQVAFAASNDESRPVLTGVLVRMSPDEESGGTTIIFASADGYRLATRTVKLPDVSLPDSSVLHEFIVPARALTELARVVADVEEDIIITVTSGGGQVLFHTPTSSLVSRLIDGKFPDFERIIPSSHTTRSVIETQELIKAVKLASFFASSSQNFIKLTFEAGGDTEPGRLIINANAAEVGDNTSELESMVQGDGGAVAMNVRFLTDALGAIDTPQVALETQSPQSPGVFKPVGQETYVHVIMPMTMR